MTDADLRAKRQAVIADFFAFCEDRPDMRFWQAVRAWSGAHAIEYVRHVPSPAHDPQGEFFSHTDTFYWEAKDS